MKRIFIGAIACVPLAGLAGSARADITISTDRTRNLSCAAGVCAPVSANAILNVNDLQNLLASGNVEVTTTGAGVQANNIVVSTGVTWSAAWQLTLDAAQSLAVEYPVAAAGAGGLNIFTNDGESGGALTFGPLGNITFQNLSSLLTINGTVYTLVNSIASLAQAGGNGFIALAQSYDASQDGTFTASPVQSLNGTFEGLGNTIANLSINDTHPEYVGLFSEIAQGAAVDDLGLANANITSPVQTNLGVGPLAGLSGGAISRVWSSGTVTSARNSAGGLVGVTNNGTIANSWSTAAITSDVNGGGGLAGEAIGSTIDDCYATGAVASTGPTWVGGLVGSAEQSLIENSFATGAVKGQGASDGGSFAGGLVGITLEQAKITNSYAMGTVGGGSYSDVGGLVGYIFRGGRFLTSYSTGAVSGGKASLTGGFAGSINQNYTPVFQNAYWDTDTSGAGEGTGNMGNIDGITGLTSTQFLSGLPDGFDANDWAESKHSNRGFPYLLENPPPSKVKLKGQ